MFFRKSIRSIIHATLIFAVGFFYCIGSSYTIEVYHDHAHDEHCNSLIFNHHHSHEKPHDHHHSDNDTSDEDGDSQDPHDRSHTHTHIVTIDLPAACVAKSLTAHFVDLAQYGFANTSETEPDGPFYDLIKPPQIG